MRELAHALGRWHEELELTFVTTRELPVPVSVVEQLSPYGPVRHADDRELEGDAIYHIPSPFEPSAIESLWPPSIRDRQLVVTLHDLIPAVFPDEQMPDVGVRRAYWARAELMRQAELVLSVSQATARDAVRLLAVPEHRLAVTGGGVSEDFHPPESRDAARADLRRLRPEIDEEFVLYTGGMDFRKNVGGLLQAYRDLPRELRDRYKLVLVGRLGPDDPRGPFGEQAEALGLADRVVFTGFVTDEELVRLYQATSLFVFPSLYEGFGLPVVEALACGAPALAGRNSSLVELVEDDTALFDAADPGDIRAALERGLGDEDVRARLCAPEIAERFSWRNIGDLTAAAYADLPPNRPRAARRLRLLAVAPLAGDHEQTTRELLEVLAGRCDVDLLVENGAEVTPPPGIECVRVGGLARVERLREYDETLYCLAGEPEYALPLNLLRQRPGLVLAYGVRLAGVYAAASTEQPELEPRRFGDIVRSLYPAHEPDAPEALEAAGLTMAREAIGAAKAFFVYDEAELPLARLDAERRDERKIELLAPERSPKAAADRIYRAITNGRPD